MLCRSYPPVIPGGEGGGGHPQYFGGQWSFVPKQLENVMLSSGLPGLSYLPYHLVIIGYLCYHVSY